MDLDLDILKQRWQGLNLQKDIESRDRLQCLPFYGQRRAMPYVAKLSRYYTRLLVVAVLWVFLGPLLLFDMPIPLWFLSLVSVFFAVMGCLMWLILRKVKSVDFGSMSMVEAMKAICAIARLRRWHKIIGVMLAVPLLCGMFYWFGLISRSMWIGGWAGLVIGLSIGLYHDYKVRKWISVLKHTVADALDGVD